MIAWMNECFVACNGEESTVGREVDQREHI